MNEENLYSIGQFAKLSGTSIKKLRYLDQKGILVPEVRNEKTNFRYYRHEQLDKITIIQTLREFGLPFSDVVHILKHKENEYMIEAVQNRIEQADEEIKDALFQYSKLISYHMLLLKSLRVKNKLNEQQNEGKPLCELIFVPEKTVISYREKGEFTSHKLFADRYFELHRMCNERKITMSSSLMGLFHDGYMKQFDGVAEDLETLVEVKDYPLGGNVRLFGGFKGVSSYYIGPYFKMKEHYIKMEKWAEERNILLEDISLEIYILGPDMTLEENEYITQLIIPLKGSVL